MTKVALNLWLLLSSQNVMYILIFYKKTNRFRFGRFLSKLNWSHWTQTSKIVERYSSFLRFKI
jgi:hypothetical protein